jgi:hypothetical protein
MKINQWEIVEVNFQMPDKRFLPHPALVISNADLIEDEFMFYAVLMSTKNHFPKYTIEISPEMLTKSTNKRSYFVTHLIGQYTPDEVLMKRNVFLKPEFRKFVKNKIITSIF